LDGHNVKITAKEKSIKVNYKDMGFEDKKQLKPNTQWEFLNILAECRGEISWKSNPEGRKSDIRKVEKEMGFESDDEDGEQNRGFSYKKAPDSFKKTKQLISKTLKSFFDLKEDPFYSYHKEKAYKIKLNLLPE